jgi:DNA-directed RNA polymerase specialized sigma24 family protein
MGMAAMKTVINLAETFGSVECTSSWAAFPVPSTRTNLRKKFAEMEIKRELPADVFDEWFSRCRQLLHFIACRVLGGSERADLAVHNCWLTASCKLPHFEREGAFRSWLLRVLIDEALAIHRLGQNENRPKDFREETS